MAVNPAFIPKELTDVYAPGNYDSNCSILACNFPTGTSVEECSNFMSWIGPVVFVEEGPSLQREANFIVVYSKPEFAVKATQEELVFNEGCRVYCRFVDAKPTVWGNITNFFQGIDQQYGASDQISNFINDTAGMFSLFENAYLGLVLVLVLELVFKLKLGVVSLNIKCLH